MTLSHIEKHKSLLSLQKINCFQTLQKKIHIFNAHNFEVMNQRPIIPK